MPRKPSRREFIQGMSVAGGWILASPYTAWAKKINPDSEISDFLKKYGPIDHLTLPQDENHFLGDQPQLKAHPLLWDKESLFKKTPRPEPKEKAKLVVIGGGISGVVSAYLLKDQQPIILEQSSRFGGNSKAEVWQNLPYALGAAYFMEQEKDSEIYKLFSKVGVHSICRFRDEEDLKLIDGQFRKNFWSGEYDKANKGQYDLLSKFFKDTLNEAQGRVYPEIPVAVKNFSEAPKKIEYLKSLDKYSLKEYLEKVVCKGQKLTPMIEQALEKYFWSAFACTMSEISAQAGVNAYAAEFGKAYVAAGGNAAVVEKFLSHLSQKMPSKNLRTEVLVVDVEVRDSGVLVTYSDKEGKLHCIQAQNVVMAAPKFVAKKIIRDLEPERLEAFSKLQYRSYLVANVLVKKKVDEKLYDFYLLGKTTPEVEQSQVSDVIVANFAKKIKGPYSVLTLYRGLPYSQGRALLYTEGNFSKYRKEIETQLQDEILPPLGLKKKDIAGLRMTRWGHPMPLNSPGLILDGTIEKIRKPFKNRVYFVHQDNWMFASLETSVEEALFWTHQIKLKT